jgi:hypothetical protein
LLELESGSPGDCRSHHGSTPKQWAILARSVLHLNHRQPPLS